jgi:hypothetical protein
VRSLLQTKGEKALDFTDTLELEYLRYQSVTSLSLSLCVRRARLTLCYRTRRLSLGLSAAQRDQILLRLHQSIFSYNPCRFVFLHDEKAEDILSLFCVCGVRCAVCGVRCAVCGVRLLLP